MADIELRNPEVNDYSTKSIEKYQLPPISLHISDKNILQKNSMTSTF